MTQDEGNKQSVPHYPQKQLRRIVAMLQGLTVNTMPVFTVKVINAATDEVLEVSQIHRSGMYYLRLDNGISIGNFAVWVEADRPENPT